MRSIRKVEAADTEAVLTVMQAARGIMRSSGNLHQWGDDYPSAEAIGLDRERGGGFVVEDEGRITGYFAFLPSPEPTYSYIEGGAWLDDCLPYHVIHRIASLPEAHGIFHDMLGWCAERESNIRIDTHRDNRIMQHLLERHGFTYCGVIYLASGDERLAYQRIKI
jgi:RimJ/RimL family protein N-acetyltransferase